MTLADWLTYTLWAIFGFMMLDFMIALFGSFWAGSFDTTFLGYLKDIMFYVIPLNFLLSMVAIDPTGWIVIVVYFIGGLSIILKYVIDIVRRFQKMAS
ncbi:hypothetical protein [Paenibacillus aestuarii]|uniref:DUF2523 domain-containing protein n=1 Tax=Paenibacillus aestuarii TaxID=516965 RepID=A0ABW0KCZ9_9BACL|nr:hypothetical protein [Paenibacillus aestuarii]